MSDPITGAGSSEADSLGGGGSTGAGSAGEAGCSSRADGGAGGTGTPDVAAEQAPDPGEPSPGEPSPGEPGQGPEDDLARALLERDGYLDSLRRLQADFENYRKRVAKQQAEQADRAAEALVGRLLPVLDTLDLALAHGAGDSAPAEGAALAQVAAALADALGKEGLVRVEPVGLPFDPVEHEAVLHETDDASGVPEVVEVLRAGWRWKGRLLRPAMVKVKG
ncbi:MAG: nucleotide exchange factor GrpE [Acidimicrobiales bacterium]